MTRPSTARIRSAKQNKEPEMLFKCSPEGAPIPGRFPGPVHARGKWFTIDIHCHVRNERATQMVAGNQDVSRWFLETQAHEKSRAVNQANGERTGEQSVSAEQRIADMDRMGIDIQAISPAPRQTYYGADPDLGLATSRAINDFIADICGRHPDRFVGLGTVPFQAPELAVAELDRLHKSLGFRGIEIMTHVAGEDLSAERFRKIFARCEELGLLVFMHPGGFLPAYSGRIDHVASARPDGCEVIDRMPTTYLKRCYFDALVYTHHQLEYLVEEYGADHILMGTDYPADMGEIDPVGMIEACPGLDDAERRAIFGGNAARLLNLEVPADRRRA